MTDTQWPRYYVFKQDRADEPHLNCGTIHAPDAEMALLTARDVFVRRPECHSLWVVSADQVVARTAEALQAAAAGGTLSGGDPSDPEESYLVFLKTDPRRQHSHAGRLMAPSPAVALARAWNEHAGRGALAYWVVPEAAIVRSQTQDEPAWFGPARNKPYRHGSFYHTDSLMRAIKAGPPAPEDGDAG